MTTAPLNTKLALAIERALSQPSSRPAGRLHFESAMAANPKIIVRLNRPYDPAMEERFAREDDIELRTCDRSAADSSIATDPSKCCVRTSFRRADRPLHRSGRSVNAILRQVSDCDFYGWRPSERNNG